MALGIALSIAQAGDLATVRSGFTWVKFHIGDPGAAGTANPAVNTTRQQATWAAIAGASFQNSNAPAWTAVPATENYTHISLWSLVSGGSFGASGVFAAAAISGGNVTIPAGGIVVTNPNVAA